MRQPSRRLVSAFAGALVLATVAATGVSATPPDGTCPPSFAEATFQEILHTFPQVVEAYGLDAALGALNRFDKNDNEIVCWRAHPTQSHVYDAKTVVANVIDDNAAPH